MGAALVALAVRDDGGRTVAAGAGVDHQRCTLPACFAADRSYALVGELRTVQGLAAVSELPFTVIGRDLVLMDAAGNELPVPAVPVTWRRDGEQ